MISFAQALLLSIRAAAAVGPATRRPRSWKWSASPRASGSSGPTTVRSMPCCWAASASAGMSLARIGRLVAMAAVPAFPGATNRASTSGLWRSFQARACSRAPLPTTITRMFALRSFPLDRARWLTGDVVDDPVDAGHLVDDPVAHPRQEVVRQACPVGGHRVLTGDGTNGADIGVGALVAHHAGRLDRQEHGEELPDIVAESGGLDLLAHDGVRPAQRLQTLRRDLAEDADREAGAGEGLSLDDLLRQAEQTPDGADLVLEQHPDRLQELEL